MNLLKKTAAGVLALCLGAVCIAQTNSLPMLDQAAAANLEDTMKWEAVKIGGAGFVSGIVTGQREMYLRTDVGGAYKWNYETSEWEQLLAFLNDADRGLLSVKGIAVDPTDDDTVYFLCGCAYFSDARTVIFKTTDGGKTFTQTDVTEHIQVHGNGDGRQCVEPIAIDPDDPDTIYAGGDVTAGKSALIKSTDGGKTWKPVMGYDDLGFFTEEINYPSWTTNTARCAEPSKEYNEQNGIGCIYVYGGKVYVGTSVTGQANIHVASVKDDKFSVLTKELPTASYPCSITGDGRGNVFFTYIAGLAFAGASGGAYKYDTKTGEVTCFDELVNAIGMIEADKNDPNKLLARTCGLWSDQWFEEEWTEDSIAWGDHFFRSTDGGETWQDITPGQGETIYDAVGSHKVFVSLPMQTNGYDWIFKKACHWGSGILLDPRNSDRILMTSGNGVYACDNVWDEMGVQFYFQPDGVEEVVALDFTSVPGGANYSAIGDYDGFIHTDINEVGKQYTPNIGSTSAIAHCPQDTKVMVRCAEHEGGAFYSMDAGKTWTKMKSPGCEGGKAAIAKVDDDTYRIFRSSASSGDVVYSDDFGDTWNDCSGIPSQYGSRSTFILSEPGDGNVVYAYATYFNSSWHYSKPEPTAEDAQYKFCVSTDGGKTFTSTDVCMYDQCDTAGRIVYLGEGELALGGGWYGMYRASVKNGKAEITKLDSVSYCKTAGYGAPEKAGGLNTIYMYGKPSETDAEGIYRSTDGGKTWDCINTNKLYGGTGNGNFLVGDMNEFGTVYMSTVGAGIICGHLDDGTEPPTKPATQPGTGSTGSTDILYGDANTDGTVDIADATKILQNIGNGDKYKLSAAGALNADCYDPGGGITALDALAVQKLDANIIKELPEFSQK